MKKHIAFLIILWIGHFSYAQDSLDKNNSIAIFGGAEYGVDMASLPTSSINFRDGFFHTAGFTMTHSFGSRWYLQPSIFYTQVLLSNSSRTDTSVTQKAHRLGIGLNAGFYMFSNEKWKIGLGGGINVLFNLAGVRWHGEFADSSVVHLSALEMNAWGVEGGLHLLVKYKFHPRWEFQMSPFVLMNIKPVFLKADDYSLRTGLNLGVGYMF